MREYKFRVWNNDTKELVKIDDLYELQINEKGRWFCMFADNLFCNFMNGFLMQYTGLRDKNGEEIFEDDIVQFVSNDKLLDKIGVVTWDDKGADYNIMGKYEGLDTEFKCAFGLIDGEYEVLGNVYEHSHLLQTNI